MELFPDSASQKQCRDCKQFFPATTDFFYVNPVNKDGLETQCVPCRSKYMSERYARKHPEAKGRAPSHRGAVRKEVIPPEIELTRQKTCLVCQISQPADLAHFPRAKGPRIQGWTP